MNSTKARAPTGAQWIDLKLRDYAIDEQKTHLQNALGFFLYLLSINKMHCGKVQWTRQQQLNE